MFRKRAVSAVAALLAFSCGLTLVHGQNDVHGQNEQDLSLAAIREYALNYAQGLPDYICTLVTEQKDSRVILIYAMNPDLFGQLQQNITSDTVVIEEELTVVGRQEDSKTVKLDGQFVGRDMRLKTGQVPATISVGEFTSVLARIFAPETGANFHWVRNGKLRGRPVIVFSIDVSRVHGARVYDDVAKHDVLVGYKGMVYADAQSHAVLRVETHSTDVPSESEFRGMDLALDYKGVKLGGREFILPYRFDLKRHRHIPGTLGKARTLPQESGVQGEYKNYRLFAGQSGITFSDVHSTVAFGGIASPEDK